MKKIKLILGLIISIFLLLAPSLSWAMSPGTLLYRTSNNGKMYGYSDDPLIYAERGIIKGINPGHVGIYIGKENGQDYIVETMSNGIVKTLAKYFVNSANGEVFLGAKIPKIANALQTAKVVAMAKSLVGKHLGYDFDFKHQKGPDSGEWTCVGLTEKLYESANISNPNNLAALEYDPEYYAVDITPDGFDNYSIINARGDVFSKDKEFSKIARRTDLILPAPEFIGFNVGVEYQDERYIFLPYTQFLQKSLKSVVADIPLSSDFNDQDFRGIVNTKAIVLRWSLINNPLSSIKNLTKRAIKTASKLAIKTKELAKNLGANIFGSNSLAEVIIDTSSISKTKTTKVFNPLLTKKGGTKSNKTKSQKKTNKSKPLVSWPSIKVNKSLVKKLVNRPSVSSQKTLYNKSDLYSSTNSGKIIFDDTTSVSQAAHPEIRIVHETTSSIPVPPYATASTSTSSLAPVLNTSNESEDSGGADTYSNKIINEAVVVHNWPRLAKINRIYASANNDFIELINTTDHDFDLATANYRLEKTKTAENPSIMIRIGNSVDGAYPGGTVIKAHGTYLIVRADASNYYRNKADALAIRKEFSWNDSAYTLYLAAGAVSSSADPDIIDAVGFGTNARYFQGQQPALAIKDNYILQRINFSSNNQADFNLIPASDPESIAIIAAAAELASSNVASSEEIATSSEEVATTTDEIASSSEEIIINMNTATSSEQTATSSEEIATSSEEIATSTETVLNAPVVLINQIYSTGNNDYLELLNPSDDDLDLAFWSYRLAKSKTALAPSLVMRIGNLEDGVYPGGTIIKAQGTYLIVRDDASDYYKNKADAIATREEFTWADSGYSFYLGTGPISSSTDPDIKDLVGFGPEAVYWQGNAAASAIAENYILNRVSQNNNNAEDFNLIFSDDPSIIIDPTLFDPPIVDANLDLFIPPMSLLSMGITQIWHFEQCYGAGHWAVGKWDCAREVNYNYDKFEAPLSPMLSLNNSSFSFYYKASSNAPRLDFRLTNSADDHLLLILDPGMITVEGLPNSEWRYYIPELIFDNKWHQAYLVVNQLEDYWAVYIDGQEVIRQIFFADLPSFSNLEMGDDNGPTLFDELVVWNRALSPGEIMNNYLVDVPYSPRTDRELQVAAQLLHSWNFEEDYGTSTMDNIDFSLLEVDPDLWVGHSHNNYALGLNIGKEYSLNFDQAIISPDLSLTFWWRNSSYPDGGRTHIYLTAGANNDENIFALLADYYRLGFWFNNQYGILAEGIDKAIPYDDVWHNLALVYDSYRYRLNFYVDGEIKASSSLIRLADGQEITGLRIKQDNFTAELDSLNVYSGALSPGQIKQLYLDTK